MQKQFTPGFDVSDTHGVEAFDSPTWIPTGPQNLPPMSQRPIFRQPGPDVGAAPVLPAGANPVSSVPMERPFPIRDAHRYAYITEIIDVPSAVNSSIALLAPAGLRNLLGMRNTHATAIIYVSFGRAASANGSTFKLTAGQVMLFDSVIPQDDMFTFTDTAGATLAISYSSIPLE